MTNRKIYDGLLTDNRRWDHIKIRNDDVIVVTPPKSGTTLMQTIVALLISGDPDIKTELSVKMPWVDIRVREISEVAGRLEDMKHRRSMKSHTPLDGLPIHDQAQYICVFRHPLDAHFSFRNHVKNIPMGLFEKWYPQPENPQETFRHFLNGPADGEACDAMPLAHILQHFKAAQARAGKPNVTLFHYIDVTRDLKGTFVKVAKLLGLSPSDELLEQLVQTASFENMKKNADRYAPGGGTGFYRSDANFFSSGTSGQWRGKLNSEELAAYDQILENSLTPEERDWLENGSSRKKRI